MFQLDWAQKRGWLDQQKLLIDWTSAVNKAKVEKVWVSNWQEHCLECAPPACYKSCPNYFERKDKSCSNLFYGIYPNPQINGLFNYGADLRFRKWAKLEAKIYLVSLSPALYNLLQNIDSALSRFVNILGDIAMIIDPRRKLNRFLTAGRDRLLSLMTKIKLTGKDLPDEFIMEAYLHEEKVCSLILEYTNETIIFRHTIRCVPGYNIHRIPAINFKRLLPGGLIKIYPENDAEIRVIFAWLNFVKYKKAKIFVKNHQLKIKCVAWDLDNTLWHGVLIEDGPDNLQISGPIIELIEQLDERGIIQTIASKNNFEDAWEIITKFKLEKYFLYPEIHWAPKSQSLKRIAQKLNLNLDTFALIDDSPFERAEVQSECPEIRTYSPEQTPFLLNFDEFNLPITNVGRKRRQMYLNEINRNKTRESFSDNYLDFLRSCEMKLRIFKPVNKEQRVRCLELIQRSNQLNLSAKRYTAEQFSDLLSAQGIECLALDCSDRFGDYGIIGFVSINCSNQQAILVDDFVLSCRVAQKRVEHSFFKWLAVNQTIRRNRGLYVRYVQTGRNQPLLKVFGDMPFRMNKNENNATLLELDIGGINDIEDVMMVEDDTA